MRKKPIYILIMILLILGNTVPIVIEAASASLSGPGTLTVGQSGTIRITSNAPGGFFQGRIYVSDPSIASVSTERVWADVGESQTQNPSWSTTIHTKKPGPVDVIIEIKGEDYDSNQIKVSNSKISINIQNKTESTPKPNPKPNPKPSNPGTGGPSAGGDKQENEKQDSKNDPEKAKELEKAIKEAENKEKQNTPLFKDIKIISNSDKKKDEVIKSIKSEKNIFEYSYTLPKRIDSFKIDIAKLNDDVELSFDKEFSFNGDENSIKIPIKAKQGDISQEIILEVKKNIDVDAVLDYENISYAIYHDVSLDEYMKENDFEAVNFNVKDIEAVKYKKSNLELVLLVDEKNNAKWVSINDKNEVQFEVDLVKNSAGKLMVITEAPEEMKSEKIRGEAYTSKKYELDKAIVDMDKSLVFDNTYMSWTLVDEEKGKSSFSNSFGISAEEVNPVNELIYAAREDGEFDLLINDNTELLTPVIMLSFDSNNNKFQTISWVLGGTLFALVGTGGFLHVSTKKKED